jgi:F-type H+-transporting ATPase subunit b
MTTVLAAESNNFLLPNATIIVVFLIFLAILFTFYRFIVPPLTKAMRERDEMVKKQAEDRDNAVRRLKQAEERYETSLAEARAEAASIRDAARADAQQIRDEMREKTDREVAEIRQRGEEQLTAQRQEAVRQLRTEIGGLSTQLAGRILGKPMDEDGPHRSTIDRFLADLDEKQPAGGKS